MCIASHTIDTSLMSHSANKKGYDVSTLRDLREKSGMTAFDLAVAADVSISTINRMETGKMPVSRRIAFKVLNALSNRIGRSIPLEEIQGLKLK